MADITKLSKVSTVDTDTVNICKNLLAKAEAGEIKGVFVVGMGDDKCYWTDMSSSMNNYTGIGCVYSALSIETVKNVGIIEDGE